MSDETDDATKLALLEEIARLRAKLNAPKAPPKTAVQVAKEPLQQRLRCAGELELLAREVAKEELRPVVETMKATLADAQHEFDVAQDRLAGLVDQVKALAAAQASPTSTPATPPATPPA